MPQPDLTIQRLQPGDAALMADLLDVFAAAFEEDALRHNRPTTRYTDDLLAQDRFIALVARRDGRVVGGLTAYDLVKYERERHEIFLYDLAVAPDCWRQGIATQLLRALQALGATTGAMGIFVQADVEDAPAIALYRSLGQGREVLHFDIAVAAL